MNCCLRNLNGLLAVILTSALAMFVSGCAATVVPATQHNPVTPDRVQIYQKEPAKYEDLGNITVLVTPEMTMDERVESTPGFDALKAKAAAKGANGVLLMSNSSDLLVTVGYHGTWYQVPMKLKPKTALAKAIFVITN